MELGSRIVWSRIKGEPRGSYSTSGVGTLMHYAIGGPLIVAGDLGLTSTAIQEIHEKENTLVVVTKNSVYEINEWK
jgi:hypothetical protein